MSFNHIFNWARNWKYFSCYFFQWKQWVLCFMVCNWKPCGASFNWNCFCFLLSEQAVKLNLLYSLGDLLTLVFPQDKSNVLYSCVMFVICARSNMSMWDLFSSDKGTPAGAWPVRRSVCLAPPGQWKQWLTQEENVSTWGKGKEFPRQRERQKNRWSLWAHRGIVPYIDQNKRHTLE